MAKVKFYNMNYYHDSIQKYLLSKHFTYFNNFKTIIFEMFNRRIGWLACLCINANVNEHEQSRSWTF
jgi:hypothetical protein